MPFFLHELHTPLAVYDGKVIPKNVIQQVVHRSTATKLSPNTEQDITPNNSYDSLTQELIIISNTLAIVRIRRIALEVGGIAYRMSARRKVELVDEPEIHTLGKPDEAETLFPIVDDSAQQLLIKKIIVYSADRDIHIRRPKRTRPVIK